MLPMRVNLYCICLVFDEQIRPKKMQEKSLFIFKFNSEIHPLSISIGPTGPIKVYFDGIPMTNPCLVFWVVVRAALDGRQNPCETYVQGSFPVEMGRRNGRDFDSWTRPSLRAELKLWRTPLGVVNRRRNGRSSSDPSADQTALYKSKRVIRAASNQSVNVNAS